jgi:hypothetical protein
MSKIEINGVEYVKKSDCIDPSNKYVLVRTYSAGVHVGYLKSRSGKEVVLNNSRRIWYWTGANTLSQLATEGTKKPDGCKFTVPVSEITLTEAIEIICVPDAARENIESVPHWTFSED